MNEKQIQLVISQLAQRIASLEIDLAVARAEITELREPTDTAAGPPAEA